MRRGCRVRHKLVAASTGKQNVLHGRCDRTTFARHLRNIKKMPPSSMRPRTLRENLDNEAQYPSHVVWRYSRVDLHGVDYLSLLVVPGQAC